MSAFQNLLKNISNRLQENIPYSHDEAKLEARFILEHVLKITQKEIIQGSGREISTGDQRKIQCIVEKRLAGAPLPYLLGEWSFFSRAFKVNSNVLIPRADTEILVETALSKVDKNKASKILDLGCGTGIIGITVALERPLSEVTLVDQSDYALKNTEENKELHHATNVIIKKSNWFNTLHEQKFDVILSNPPYLAENDPHLIGALQNEPREALVSGVKGTEAIQHITKFSRIHLKPNGWLMIEHGYNQAEVTQNIFIQNYFKNIEQKLDIQKILRVTLGQA